MGDAAALSRLSSFDLVTAVHLLNYAASQDYMGGMGRRARDNLIEGRRFVAYTINPADTLGNQVGGRDRAVLAQEGTWI